MLCAMVMITANLWVNPCMVVSVKQEPGSCLIYTHASAQIFGYQKVTDVTCQEVIKLINPERGVK